MRNSEQVVFLIRLGSNNLPETSGTNKSPRGKSMIQVKQPLYSPQEARRLAGPNATAINSDSIPAGIQFWHGYCQLNVMEEQFHQLRQAESTFRHLAN